MSGPRTIGPYDLMEELGRGGMGAVYRARDSRDGREVAVKVLLSNSQTDERRRQRFAREVEALRRLEHPNVVGVVDAGQQGNLPWLALAYVAGETLEERLRLAGPLSLPEVEQLVIELGGALRAAHEAGVLHRDLKPDNVLIEEGTGRFLLTDFGLAREVELAESRRLSLTGAMMGTPGFWAPEQAAGEATGPWTDVYGFGATIYAALTGQPPIQGGSFIEIVNATCRTPPDPIRAHRSDLPRQLERAVQRSLAKDPAERFDSIAAMVEQALAAEAAPRSAGGLIGLLLVLGVVAGGLIVALASRGGVPTAARTEAPPPEAAPTLAPTTPVAPPPTATLQEQVRALASAGRLAELFTLLERAANTGDPEACYLFGTLFVEGLGVAANDVTALKWFRKAAAAGVPKADAQIGRLHLLGLGGLPRDPAQAVPFLKRAADQGVSVAMVNLGLVRLKGLDGSPPDASAALRWFVQAAKTGNAGAAVRVGEMYGRGIGTPSDPAESVRWFRRAAEQGDLDGAYFLGLGYEVGNGVEVDHRLALKWLTRAGAGGHAQACLRLGDLYERAVRIEPNPSERLRWYLAAAEAGAPRAMHVLYRIYRHEPIADGRARSLEWLRRSVKAGYPRALADMAGLMARGAGVPRDAASAQRLIARARTLLQRDARSGDPAALVELGTLIHKSSLPDRDRVGVSQFRLAATKGSAEGMVRLAECYAIGKGVPSDQRLVFEWLQRASDLGHAPAMELLATAHFQGRGTPKSESLALAWLRKSVARGWRESMYKLGLILDKGAPDRPRDPIGAVKWLSEAARRDHTEAMLLLALIQAGLKGDPPDPDQARRWLDRARPRLPASDAGRQAAVRRIEAALARLKR